MPPAITDNPLAANAAIDAAPPASASIVAVAVVHFHRHRTLFIVVGVASAIVVLAVAGTILWVCFFKRADAGPAAVTKSSSAKELGLDTGSIVIEMPQVDQPQLPATIAHEPVQAVAPDPVEVSAAVVDEQEQTGPAQAEEPPTADETEPANMDPSDSVPYIMAPGVFAEDSMDFEAESSISACTLPEAIKTLLKEHGLTTGETNEQTAITREFTAEHEAEIIIMPTVEVCSEQATVVETTITKAETVAGLSPLLLSDDASLPETIKDDPLPSVAIYSADDNITPEVTSKAEGIITSLPLDMQQEVGGITPTQSTPNVPSEPAIEQDASIPEPISKRIGDSPKAKALYEFALRSFASSENNIGSHDSDDGMQPSASHASFDGAGDVQDEDTAHSGGLYGWEETTGFTMSMVFGTHRDIEPITDIGLYGAGLSTPAIRPYRVGSWRMSYESTASEKEEREAFFRRFASDSPSSSEEQQQLGGHPDDDTREVDATFLGASMTTAPDEADSTLYLVSQPSEVDVPTPSPTNPKDKGSGSKLSSPKTPSSKIPKLSFLGSLGSSARKRFTGKTTVSHGDANVLDTPRSTSSTASSTSKRNLRRPFRSLFSSTPKQATVQVLVTKTVDSDTFGRAKARGSGLASRSHARTSSIVKGENVQPTINSKRVSGLSGFSRRNAVTSKVSSKLSIWR